MLNLAKRLWSVFTDDMDCCYFTGSYLVERHHIFSHTASERNASERYGFIIPLRPDLHPNGVHFKPPKGFERIDEDLKKMAQTYFEEHYGTREEFREIFFKSWL